jgi:hypothetical protein
MASDGPAHRDRIRAADGDGQQALARVQAVLADVRPGR